MKAFICARAATLFVFAGLLVSTAPAAEVFPSATSWRYYIGTNEASPAGVALWRLVDFDDASWGTGMAPLGYGETGLGTTLPSPSQTTPQYLSVYLRKKFTVTNPAAIDRLTLNVNCDDGFVAWINGVEVGRANVPAGTLFFSDAALTAIEPTVTTISVPNAASLLVAGENVVAIHAFNANTTSSDLLIAAELFSHLDDTPPVIVRQTPAPGTTVRVLTDVEVLFSEPVNGVDAGDLLLNGVAATNVFETDPGQFVWQFSESATGLVSIAFISGHGITDQSPQANPFGGASWNVTYNPNAPVYGVVISEIMAENDNGIRDEDGDTSDWIELYNGADEPANLGGWFLTDDVLDLTKWRIPSVTIDPNGYLLIWASQKNRTNNPAALHANFALANNGEYLALVDPNTNVVSAFAPSYPRQTADVSYGRDRIDPTLVGFYTNSTPRNHNTTAGAGVLPEVRFSRASSTFVEPFELTLSVDSTNAEIRYLVVTNRMSATNVNFLSITNLRLYTGPITIQGSWQIRARAFPKPGTTFFPSAFHTESYIQLNPNVLSFNSDLPLVIIHDFGAGPYDQSSTQREETSVIAFFEPGYDRSSLTNQPVLVSRAGINARGSSTLGYQKVSLAVELWSEVNDDADKPVLGMKPESDWVFYAPNNFEPVLFHNPLYYQLSRDVGRWASETRYAEVFLNTSTNAVSTNHYNGIYVVTEKVKRSPSRLNIPNLDLEDTNAPAITGGYLLSIDRVDPGEQTFPTAAFGAPTNIQSYSLIYVDPSARNGMHFTSPGPRDPQERYIANYINTMITNLASATFTNVPKIYEQHIDVDSWIDHIQIAMAAFNVDAVRLSGFLYKDRNKRIEFGPVWDCDRCMGSTDGRELQPRTWTGSGDRSDFFNPGGSLPNFWFQRLFRDIDFWQRYVDRYQELRAGPFHMTNINARIDQNVAQLTNAYPREFARWRQAPRRYTANANGTYTLTTSGGTYETEVAWKREWFRARFDFLDTNLLDRPLLSFAGGMVPAGTTVTLTPPSRSGSTTNTAYVIYTLDGTDPRAPHGRIAANAFSNLGPVTITITNNARLVARSFHPQHRNMTGTDRPPLSTPWSGPVSATYVVTTPALRITEIMYHPAPAPDGDTNDQDNFEYVEVKNIGSTALDLGGFRISGGIEFTFPPVMLGAGQSGVVVRHAAAFQSRYGSGPTVLGVYSNNLANDGDCLVLEGPLREPIHNFCYSDAWYRITDGPGFSLVLADAHTPPGDLGSNSVWRASAAVNGSPGADDPTPAVIPGILINEALTHTDPSPGDAVELWNPTGGDVDIGGWFLTDSFASPKKYRIPDGTVISAGGFKVFYQSNSFGVGDGAFALNSRGDDLYLFSANGAGELSGYFHGFGFGAQANGITFGRHVTSTGDDHFVTQISPTLGQANSGPKVGPVVISEISYHPVAIRVPNGQLINNKVDEFIELHNLSEVSVPLYDPAFPTNTWRLRDAVDFEFPMGTSLSPNGYCLVVSFDPADSATLNAFKLRNGVPEEVPIYGPFRGELDNDGDSVELERPDLPQMFPAPDAGFVPYILVERVRYDNAAPWPVAADGIGPTLQRRVEGDYGNDAANWAPAGRTPGSSYVSGPVPVITLQPQSQTSVAYDELRLSVRATGPGPLSYQWRLNGTPIFGAVAPDYVVPSVPAEEAGVYDVIVLNASGAVASEPATVTLLIPPRFTTQPVTQAVRVGVPASFSVAVVSTAPPVTYQWYRNGQLLPGQTDPVLNIASVSLEDRGIYFCRVADGVKATNSASAELIVLVDPTIVRQPLAADVAP
ncbi:MAG TPA: lamin tail domain-containing protein, partial [Methylomirabilota bacterium]|nr:lamin tail domain-containing protein [Methylomirabilota bacterium]